MIVAEGFFRVEAYLDYYEKDSQSGNRTRGSTFFLYFFVSTFKNVVSVGNCINFLKDLKVKWLRFQGLNIFRRKENSMQIQLLRQCF